MDELKPARNLPIIQHACIAVYAVVLWFLTPAVSSQIPMKETKMKKELSKQPKDGPIAIAIHGGAADIVAMGLSEQQQKAYTDGLNEALTAGYKILETGGRAEDAVIAAVMILEDNPLFNAGKGSVFTHNGDIEMDAALMTGHDMRCGSVSGVSHIKNPIKAAALIKDSSKYVFLYGSGAEEYVFKKGLDSISMDYFKTEFRRNQWLRQQKTDSTSLDHDGDTKPLDEKKQQKFGTVGCVALDREGHLASGTSTGGIVNKRYHRIGDTPIIGAGTLANQRVAISCTGRGEEFIRLSLAGRIATKMEFKRNSLRKAVQSTVLEELPAMGGRGGCIAINHKGQIAVEFTTSGMFRGFIDTEGKKFIGIYR
jgi:beta-aspartyl-peptidase (threonine type)